MTKPRSDPKYSLALTAFALAHRLKSVRGADESYVQGRDGTVTEYSPDRLHLVLSPGTGNAGWWNNRRRTALASGMTLDQDGDTEGSLIFDPNNREQALSAVRLSGSRQRRVVSEIQRATLAKHARPFERKPDVATGQTSTLKPMIAA